MRITLLRHAQVIESHLGKYNGHIDISLSEHGKIQAKKVAKELESENFDAIYCSDLLRARETLNAFNYKIAPTFTDKLREKSWGIHEGKSFDEIQDSGIIYENFEQWTTALDGENIDDYTSKIQEYFYNTILKTQAKNVLIVTHSGFIKTLLSIHKNISLEEVFSIDLPYSSYIQLNF